MSTKQSDTLDLKIIGAGFPRTGTNSLQSALIILGYPCHHMFEVFADETTYQPRAWLDLFRRKDQGLPLDFGRVLHGYTALVDSPGCDFAVELAQQFPEAKVIYTHRSGESWRKSLAPIFMCLSPVYGILTYWVGPLYWQRQLGLHGIVKHAEKKYGMKYGHPDMMEARTREIVDKIAPERLLIFQVKEGWEPLCKFLDVPVPDVPFPNLNNSDALGAFVGKLMLKGLGRWAVILAGVVAAAMAARRLK
ncbi:hypothetical protein T439DRAFT_327167 [Meredithblackwellia eburnea MCA 4105]